MDPRIKAPCPFCGEREHLQFSSGGIPRPIVRDGDTVRAANGLEAFEEADGVFCEVCSASAPVDVWNGEVPYEVFAILRDFDPPTGAEIVPDQAQRLAAQAVTTGAELPDMEGVA